MDRYFTRLAFEHCPSLVKTCALAGCLQVFSDGSVAINGVAGKVAFFDSRVDLVVVQITGGTTLRIIDGLPLSDLSVDELQEIVEWASVETEAQTAGGLRRANERHYGI